MNCVFFFNVYEIISLEVLQNNHTGVYVDLKFNSDATRDRLFMKMICIFREIVKRYNILWYTRVTTTDLSYNIVIL